MPNRPPLTQREFRLLQLVPDRPVTVEWLVAVSNEPDRFARAAIHVLRYRGLLKSVSGRHVRRARPLAPKEGTDG